MISMTAATSSVLRRSSSSASSAAVFGGQLGTLLQPGGAVKDRPADSFRPAQAGGFELGQRPESLGVQAHANG